LNWNILRKYGNIHIDKISHCESVEKNASFFEVNDCHPFNICHGKNRLIEAIGQGHCAQQQVETREEQPSFVE
jgi:hypothetical protein